MHWRLVEGYPDYHPEHPGGKPGGGRSLDPELFAFGELGEWAELVLNNGMPLPMYLAETPLGGGPASSIQRCWPSGQARTAGHGPGAGRLAAARARPGHRAGARRPRPLVLGDGRITGVDIELADGGEHHVAAAAAW